MSDLEDLKETVKETTDSVDELNDSLKEIDPTIDSTDVENLEEDLDESTTSAEELNDSLNNINGSGLSEAADEADNLKNSLEGAKDSSDEVNDSLGVINAASYQGLAEGIGSYASGAENLAQEMNTAAISVGQLATQVGMAEPQMVSLINHISNATFPQNEAMAYVQALNQMGVAANQLGDSATNMDKINDATGIGYQKVMQLTMGLRAVGVEANNLPSAFNAIAYAQSNVNGGADTLTQVLKTQAATINEYGLNVDQLVVIMAKLSEQGVQGKKMGSELSKVLKECNGDTRALEQALGLQAGALSNASSATGKYSGQLQKLANEEAEHKTIIDKLGAAWEDLSLMLSPVISPLASILGLVGQFAQFALAINSIITLAQTFGLLGAAETSLIPVQIAEGTAGWFSVGWAILAVIAILALVAALIYLYNTNEGFRNFINGIGEGFMWICGIIYNSLIAAFEWLKGAWQNTVNFFQQYGQLFLEIMFVVLTGPIGIIALLIANFMGMPNQIGGALQNVLSRAVAWGSSMVNNMINVARRGVTGFINQIAQLPGRVYNELAKTLQRVMDFGSQIVARLGEIAQRAWQAFIHGLGIHSPGYIQTLTLKELEDTGKKIPTSASGIIRNVGIAADEVVNAWDNPQLGISTANNGNANFNRNMGNVSYIFNLYGDMDNEDRMEKFIEAVRREINWNNDLAGRRADI